MGWGGIKYICGDRWLKAIVNNLLQSRLGRGHEPSMAYVAILGPMVYCWDLHGPDFF